MIPILRICDLSYSYDGNHLALDRVNLSIGQGEKIAVLGANGAGKSTLFLIMNGVLSPDSGRIYYREREIKKKEINELRKNVGIVFQDADNQIIASTVQAEVSFGPMNLKLSKDEVRERVREALEYMNMADFKDRPPHYLSGGEKKKVSIADILAMKPEIILFDEPTASLDPLNAAMLEEILERLSKEKKTIIASTHDVDFAYRFADRILIFNQGAILADAPPPEVFRRKEMLKSANLKQPILMDIYEMMVESHLLKNGKCPKNTEELRALLMKPPSGE